MYSVIKKLVKPFGVSGNENEISGFIEEEIRNHCDEVIKDVLGNIIAVKYSSNKEAKKIMLAAHMDTVGIMITHIDDRGYIRFSPAGGLKPHCCIGQTVEFSNGIKGVIYYDAAIKELKDLKMSSLYIDTGINNADEIKSKFHAGMYAKFVFSTYTQGDTIISGGLDDRAGCSVLLETARRMDEDIKSGYSDQDMHIYYVFTVQEELGLRGAGPAAFAISPDYSVIVDVTYAEDIPGCKSGSVSMGAGPVISIKDEKTIYHPYMRDRLSAVAQESKIPCQMGIVDKGATDAGAIHKVQGGVITGGICLPVRYIHSSAEMCSIKDLKNTVELLTSFLKMKI